MAGIQVTYDKNRERIVRAAHVAQALSERYPSVAPCVICALAWCVPLALNWRRWLAAHVAVVAIGAALWWAPDLWRWARTRRRPQLEAKADPIDYPERWFHSVCRFAQIKPVPMVLDHYPTESGHAFYVLVTHDLGLEGRPLTVESLIEMGSLLRDSAGVGCTTCKAVRDEDNGGRAIVYFNGITFEGYELPEPEPEGVRCIMVGCDKAAAVHVTLDDGERWSIMCEGHAIAYADRIDDHHPVTDHCHEADCWPDDIDPTTELPELVPNGDATDRKWGAPIGPAMDPHLREEGPSEGSGVAYPPGVEADSTRGRILDALRAAQGPLRRGTIANLTDMSPTTVEGHLAALRDLDAVEKVGPLWVASTSYRSSGMFSTDGQEDEHS